MARLWTTGAEGRDMGVAGKNGLDGIRAASGSPTNINLAEARTGTRVYQTTASQNIGGFETQVLGRAYFWRGYLRVPSSAGFPLADCSIVSSDSTAAGTYNVRLTTSGTLRLRSGTSNIGSASAALAFDTWYRIEFMFQIGSGSSDDSAELRLDGATVASETNQTRGTSVSIMSFGEFSGVTTTLYWDDIALNDDQGASQNTWPGAGKVVLLLPISDNARATLWTGGSGGTTNLFDAVDNTPPVGTATETNTTQIEHAGGAAGTTDAYDANMTTPATAGIGASDVINTVHFIEADGEDVSAGTKLLNFEVLSNPVIASPGNVTAGADAGALGTYPTNWTIRQSPPVYGPTLTVGTSPVMRVRRPETASRVASVCFMGITIDYTPAPATLPPDRGRRRRSMQRTRV